jgi:hypothetical protein
LFKACTIPALGLALNLLVISYIHPPCNFGTKPQTQTQTIYIDLPFKVALQLNS